MLKVGVDFKIYYNSGTDASAVWVEIDIVGDVSVTPLGVIAASVPIRQTKWSLRLPGRQQESQFEFSLANDIGGTVFDALRGFAISTTPGVNQYAAVDGDILVSGAQGMKAFGFFTDFPQSQPLDDMAAGDCVVAFAYYQESGALIEPSWHITP